MIIRTKPSTAPGCAPPGEVQTWEVPAQAQGQRLDNFLLRHLKGVPKTHVYRIIRSGEVRLNGGRVQAQTRVNAGDSLRVPPVRVAQRESVPLPRRGPTL
ncbi:MAG: S4 domain-containing protein, partial [Burkholderiaceae bacterium]